MILKKKLKIQKKKLLSYYNGAILLRSIVVAYFFMRIFHITNITLICSKRRETMVLALTCLRARSEILVSALESFVQEPTLDWTQTARTEAK